jgi:hypothetical protein
LIASWSGAQLDTFYEHIYASRKKNVEEDGEWFVSDGLIYFHGWDNPAHFLFLVIYFLVSRARQKLGDQKRSEKRKSMNS